MMNNISNDFSVVTIKRDDIACVIFMRHYKIPDDLAFNRASFICNEMMQVIADEMSEIYFEDNVYVDFNTWLLTAWNNLNLNETTCLDVPGGFQVGA
jgi:hypothetical protein